MHQGHKNIITQKKLKLNPGLVASYYLRPGNRVGLFSKEMASKEVDKYGKISTEKRKWGSQVNKQIIYIAPKSTNKSRAHYTPEPTWDPQPPSNTWFLCPTHVHTPNGFSISSAIFAGPTIVTDRQTIVLHLQQQTASM